MAARHRHHSNCLLTRHIEPLKPKTKGRSRTVLFDSVIEGRRLIRLALHSTEDQPGALEASQNRKKQQDADYCQETDDHRDKGGEIG